MKALFLVLALLLVSGFRCPVLGKLGEDETKPWSKSSLSLWVPDAKRPATAPKSFVDLRKLRGTLLRLSQKQQQTLRMHLTKSLSSRSDERVAEIPHHALFFVILQDEGNSPRVITIGFSTWTISGKNHAKKSYIGENEDMLYYLKDLTGQK